MNVIAEKAHIKAFKENMRVYIDASVFGGFFDEEFAETSRLFFDAIFDEGIIALISDILVAELVSAPQKVRELLDRISEISFERLEYNVEAVNLQRAYLKAEVLPSKCEGDLLHVAYVTLARADVIASWNFRHLVNPAKQRAFNGVNLVNGYGLITVMTPLEVIKILGENDDE